MQTKIQTHHKSKLAYIYLRQSTMGQVRLNRESTERQYALQDKALQLGWAANQVRLLDGDLGCSGRQMTQRNDFKTLVTDVSMNKVGAVFALEASRLSRSCTDWHRLLELCALTMTLIIDEDGIYDPADFNDQLLLGLKGTMSQAELHIIHARLQGGKLNKAKKGQLRFPLPVGLCYDDQGQIMLDPDEQVRHSIETIFRAFEQCKSAFGVVQYFVHHQFLFPKRAYGGIWKGKLQWGPLTHARVISIIKNPTYAGTYVYGRHKHCKHLTEDGKIVTKTQRLPREAWEVVIPNHHPGYISWDRYLAHQKQIADNRTNDKTTLLPSALREGLTLLQGLLICQCCGRRLTVRYQGNGGIYPTYLCGWRKRDGLSKYLCLSVSGELLDQAVTHRVLKAVTPDQLQLAIKAFEEIEQRLHTIESQWQLRIQREEYEAQLAQQRYENVNSNNRLIAATLEQRWNDALLKLEQVKTQYEHYRQTDALPSLAQHKNRIMALADDLPRLWNASTTSAKDRKRIIRLLIKDITIELDSSRKLVLLHMRWQGGALEKVEVELPARNYEKWRHPQALIDQVRALAKTLIDEQIAAQFNQKKMKTNKGNAFTASCIQWIRYKHKIPGPNYQQSNEQSVKEVAIKYGVSTHVVYYWINRGIINTRRDPRSRLWITIDRDTERELLLWVENSPRIKPVELQQQSSFTNPH